ncbi:hypothetical protein ACFLTH_11090 [Bacteroidota bacterium]
MNSKGLQKMVKPLDDLLAEHDFVMVNSPMYDNSLRVATFARADGKKIEYIFQFIEDKTRGQKFDTCISFHLVFYKNSKPNCKPIQLNKHNIWDSNKNTAANIKNYVDNKIKPKLKEYI